MPPRKNKKVVKNVVENIENVSENVSDVVPESITNGIPFAVETAPENAEPAVKTVIAKRDCFYGDDSHTQYLTKDKEYIITNDNEGSFTITNDNGNTHCFLRDGRAEDLFIF